MARTQSQNTVSEQIHIDRKVRNGMESTKNDSNI